MNRINNSQTKHKQNFNRKAVAFLKKLCCLPPLPTLLIAVPSFALVISVTGAGVSILILGMAVSMIVQTTGRLHAGTKEVPSCREL